MVTDRRSFLKSTVVGAVAVSAAAAATKAEAQGAKVKPGPRDVLLVVDVQNDFIPGGALPVQEGDLIVPLVNRLAAGFDHVILTQDWHTPGHVSFASTHPGKKPFETVKLEYGTQVLWPDHCVQGTPGADFHKDLKVPHAELIIRKGYRKQMDSYSAFYEADGKATTGLAGYVKDRGFQQVYLVGLATDFGGAGREKGGARGRGHRGRLPRHRHQRLARQGLGPDGQGRRQAHPLHRHQGLDP